MIDRVVDNLYITGGLPDITPKALSDLKIDAVVLVAKDICGIEWDTKFEKYEYPIQDNYDDQTPMFKEVTEKICSLLRDGKHVLVSCKGGISRSSIVCICVLHELTGAEWNDCENVMREVHPQSSMLNRPLYRLCQEYWEEPSLLSKAVSRLKKT